MTHLNIRNIFLSGRNLVIGDFGHAIKGDEQCEEIKNRKFGTDNYNAPEVNDESSYTEKIDIW